MALNNIKPLNGIRAIAILLVIIWHYFNCQVSWNLLEGNMKYVTYLTFWTWSGVDLFFVLSGFLIGRILLFNKQSNNYFKTFYLRRFFRIFPAYYLVLLVFLIFLLTGWDNSFPWLTQHPYPLYSYALYIQNFWMAISGLGPHWLGVTWSLAIEEQFYLVLPFVIFFLNKKYIPAFLIVCIVLAPFCRALINDFGSYVLLPARMDSLLIGVLIAHYYLKGSIQRIFRNRQRSLILVMLVLFLLLFVIAIRKGGETIGGTFIHSILAMLYAAFLILVLTLKADSKLTRILSNYAMSFFARISYMIYLTHQVFSGLLHERILNQSPQINNFTDAGVSMLALAATITFSALSYSWFEKPILALGKYYKY
jgi:peptidoglycan/LPS O-acetylase OafA/YrhL